jgi:hypothetical protein
VHDFSVTARWSVARWRRPSRQAVGTTLVIWAPLLVWWLALLPGGISIDSRDVWREVVGHPWSNHHPAPYAAFVWLTSLGGTTVAGATLAQTVCVAASLSALVRALAARLGTLLAPLMAAVALGVLPLLGPFSVTLWKDVPETAALVWLSARILAPASNQTSRGRLLSLATAAGVAASLRWNGGAACVIAALVALPDWPRVLRARHAATIAAAGVAGTLVIMLIPHVAPVSPPGPVDTSAQQLADLAQFAYHAPAAFDPRERATLERVAPFPRWRSAGGHSCRTINDVTVTMIISEHREAALHAAVGALDRVWRSVAFTHPWQLLRAHLCRAALAWVVVDPPSSPPIVTVWPWVRPVGDGLRSQSPHWLRRPFESYAALSDRRWVQDLFWRPASWLVLVVIAGVVVGRRRRPVGAPVAGLLAVPVGVVLSYAALPAAQDARYTYPSVVICQLGVVALLSRALRARAAAEQEPRSSADPERSNGSAP